MKKTAIFLAVMLTVGGISWGASRPWFATLFQGAQPSGDPFEANPLVVGGVNADGGITTFRTDSTGRLETTATLSGTITVADVTVSGGVDIDNELDVIHADLIDLHTIIDSGTVTVTGGSAIDAELVAIRGDLDDVILHDYTSATAGAALIDIGAVHLAPNRSGSDGAECCATDSTGGTTCSALPANTSWLAAENRGPNYVVCTWNGTTPTLSIGKRLAGIGGATTDPADGFGPIPVTTTASLKCIAATAAQSTGACVVFFTGSYK